MATFRNNGNRKVFLISKGKKAELAPNQTIVIDLNENDEVIFSFGEASTTHKKWGVTKFRLMIDTMLIMPNREKDTEITLSNKKSAFFADSTTYEYIIAECLAGNIDLKKQYALVNEKEILEIYRLSFRKAKIFDVFEPSGLIGICLGAVGIIALLEAIIINIWAGLLTLLVAYALCCTVNAFFAPTIDNRTKKKLKDNGYPDDMILFAENIEHLINNPPENNEFWWDYWKRTKGI